MGRDRRAIAGCSRFGHDGVRIVAVGIGEHRHVVDALPAEDVERLLELALELVTAESGQVCVRTGVRSERDAVIGHLANFIPVEEAPAVGNL